MDNIEQITNCISPSPTMSAKRSIFACCWASWKASSTQWLMTRNWMAEEKSPSHHFCSLSAACLLHNSHGVLRVVQLVQEEPHRGVKVVEVEPDWDIYIFDIVSKWWKVLKTAAGELPVMFRQRQRVETGSQQCSGFFILHFRVQTVGEWNLRKCVSVFKDDYMNLRWEEIINREWT